jgi:hypothetical protein
MAAWMISCLHAIPRVRATESKPIFHLEKLPHQQSCVAGVQEHDRLAPRPSFSDAAKPARPEQARSFRMLAAYMDLGACYKLVGNTQHASAELRGLHVETQVSVGGHKVCPSTCPSRTWMCIKTFCRRTFSVMVAEKGSQHCLCSTLRSRW